MPTGRGGVLLLKDTTEAVNRRLYGHTRLPMLFANWTVLRYYGMPGDHDLNRNGCILGGVTLSVEDQLNRIGGRHTQPVFVLKVDALPLRL